MLEIDGLSDEELEMLFERLREGGEAEVMTADGHKVHVSVRGIDRNSVNEANGDW